MKMMNITETLKHKYVVPTLYTLIWAVSLLMSLVGDTLLANLGLFPRITSIHGEISWLFWSVYVAFLFEFIVCAFDLIVQYKNMRFRGLVMYNLLYFAVTAGGVLVSWNLYDKSISGEIANKSFFIVMVLFAIMQKYHTTWLSNNIDKYFANDAPITIQTEAA